MSVYLDHNASAPLRPEAAAAMAPWLDGRPGNASSVHGFGRAARSAVDRARRQVAALLGVDPHEILFTGSGTESVVTAIVGAARAAGPGPVVISGAEHSAGREAARMLEGVGRRVTWAAPGVDGVVPASAVRDALRDDTVLVSLIHAHNETGVIQPVPEAAAICRERGVKLHTDAVQSAGKVPVRAADLGADLISLAAHKLGGPQGVGALWVRGGTALAPLVPGAQESGRRGGTHNTAGIAGFGAAAEAAAGESWDHVTALRERLERAVAAAVPEAQVVGADARRLPNTTLFVFPPEAGPDLVPALDMAGYAVSVGSACASGAAEASPTLRAMGIPEARARTAVRVSLGHGNTEADVDGFVAALAGILGARTPR